MMKKNSFRNETPSPYQGILLILLPNDTRPYLDDQWIIMSDEWRVTKHFVVGGWRTASLKEHFVWGALRLREKIYHENTKVRKRESLFWQDWLDFLDFFIFSFLMPLRGTAGEKLKRFAQGFCKFVIVRGCIYRKGHLAGCRKYPKYPV